MSGLNGGAIVQPVKTWDFESQNPSSILGSTNNTLRVAERLIEYPKKESKETKEREVCRETVGNLFVLLIAHRRRIHDCPFTGRHLIGRTIFLVLGSDSRNEGI